MSAGRLTRDDFDAALVPGFRDATRSEYRALDRAWRETSATVLDEAGGFMRGADMERDCPLCRTPGSQGALLFEKLGMKIVLCPGCGLTYSRNVLREAFDRQLYVDSASQTSYQDLKRNETYAALERVKCDYILQRLADFRPPPGSLLDIGPGNGRLLEAAAAAGWDTLGIEANAAFAADCRRRGLSIVEGFFPDVLAPEARFDVITLLDVVEHLHEPVALLRTAAARLARGGVIVVQVPNVDSLLVQLEGARNSNFCHGHWSHFNLKTLARLGREAALEPLGAETIITEIDRIRAHPATDIAATARRLAGVEPPADLDAAWVHAHGMGYKALAFFGARSDG
jgi:2-polyprenyl-3-methyl-5-hydroxy-6-metoxy-1,4-benzoquinol methylase